MKEILQPKIKRTSKKKSKFVCSKVSLQTKQSQLLFLYLLSSLCNTFELRWPWLEVGLQMLWKGDFSSLERPSRRNCLSWFFPRSLICLPSSCPYFFSFPAEIFHQLSQALAVLTDAAARVRMLPWEGWDFGLLLGAVFLPVLLPAPTETP